MSADVPVTPAPAAGVRTVSVQVVTPDGVVWEGPVRSVTVPSQAGALGILARHEPVAAVLVRGTVRLRPVAGEPRELAITGGFVVVDDDDVTVLVDALA